MFEVLPDSELPAVDERLVAPGSRYEILDGWIEYVPPADEPRSRLLSKLALLLEAHVTSDYTVAIGMLTRTSRLDDIASDASVYPIARDPRTGGRKLEELAFEIASTESLARAARKAGKLATRGVRRVFAIDIEQQCVSEWSNDAGAWSTLDPDGSIEDITLAAPLSVAAVVRADAAEDAVVWALLAKKNPVLVAKLEAQHAIALREETDARREGEPIGLVPEGDARAKAKAVLMLLDTRKIELTTEQRARILDERGRARLTGWLLAAATRADAAEFFKNA
jgi:hypothetical protein